MVGTAVESDPWYQILIGRAFASSNSSERGLYFSWNHVDFSCPLIYEPSVFPFPILNLFFCDMSEAPWVFFYKNAGMSPWASAYLYLHARTFQISNTTSFLCSYSFMYVVKMLWIYVFQVWNCGFVVYIFMILNLEI